MDEAAQLEDFHIGAIAKFQVWGGGLSKFDLSREIFKITGRPDVQYFVVRNKTGNIFTNAVKRDGSYLFIYQLPELIPGDIFFFPVAAGMRARKKVPEV